MMSIAEEQRCNARTERIMEQLFLFFEAEREYISEEALTFDVVLSKLKNHFSTMQEKNNFKEEGDMSRTVFTELAHEKLKDTLDGFFFNNLKTDIEEMVIEGMEASIVEIVDAYFPGFLEANEESNEESQFHEDIYHERCNQCAEIVWDECKFCIFDQDIANYIDDYIIRSTSGCFVEIINTACESTIDMLEDNVPNTIYLALQEILLEIYEKVDACNMGTADLSWEVVSDEVAPIFEADAAGIYKQICIEIDYVTTSAYIEAVSSSFIIDTPKFKEEMRNEVEDEMNEITEEVRFMEI